MKEPEKIDLSSLEIPEEKRERMKTLLQVISGNRALGKFAKLSGNALFFRWFGERGTGKAAL